MVPEICVNVVCTRDNFLLSLYSDLALGLLHDDNKTAACWQHCTGKQADSHSRLSIGSREEKGGAKHQESLLGFDTSTEKKAVRRALENYIVCIPVFTRMFLPLPLFRSLILSFFSHATATKD